jgi:signal transduction histidine kinase
LKALSAAGTGAAAETATAGLSGAAAKPRIRTRNRSGRSGGSRNVRVWVFVCAALALLTLAALRMDTMTWGAVGIMSALGLATSLFSFRLDEKTSVTFGPAVFMGSIALFGVLVAVWVAAISCILLELVRFRRGGAPAFARVGIRVIAVLGAAAVYMLVGGVVGPTGLSLMDAGRFVLMFAVFALIAGALEASLDTRGSGRFRRYVRWLSGRGVVIELAMLPLSLLLVASYIPGEPATFPLLAVVLIISSAAGQKLWDTQQSLLDRVNELKALNSVGSALNCAIRVDDLVRLVHQHTREQLSAPVLSVALHHAGADALEFRTCVLDQCDVASGTSERNGSFTGWVVQNRKPLNVPDIRREKTLALAKPIIERIEARGVDVRSWLGVPLVSENKLVGVLSIMSDQPRAFDDATTELVTTIGSQVGKVVETARLYEQLEAARRAAEDWNKKLELKVDERTKELSEARAELETLNEDLERRVEERTRELRDVQTRIVQSGRLAAIGELSAGVAHELNNPLAGILGYAQYDLETLQKADADSVTQEDLEKLTNHLAFIEQGARRCTEIVESLLRFADSTRCASTEVNVNRLIQETVDFTSRELSSRGIELKTELAEDRLEVMGDPRQLQQVFANIILNARKAMQSGGRLSVASSRLTRDNGDGDVVAISFGDTGCGISNENLVRVFEPFFTTGQVGDGSGLGLSVSYGIVKDHGGDIEVVSKEGVGSTFTVLLPLVESKKIDNPFNADNPYQRRL